MSTETETIQAAVVALHAQYDNPYKQLLAAGIPMDSHASDLYVLATDEARRIVKASGWTHMPFVSNIDGKVWLDIAFAYEPFWELRARE